MKRSRSTAGPGRSATRPARARLAPALLAALVLTACSGGVRDVTGEPLYVTLSGLERQASNVVVELAVRNPNDIARRLDEISLSLALDDEPLASGGQHVPLTISARGREMLHITLPARPGGLGRLTALADDDVRRLPWSMETTLTVEQRRARPVKVEGWLHRVPGQPGRFR